MKQWVSVASFVTLADVAIGTLIVGLVAGEPQDKLRFWLALAIVAIGPLSFVAGLFGSWAESLKRDDYIADVRAQHERQIYVIQEKAAEQFTAGFDYANGLAARSVDSVSKSWATAYKRAPNQAPIGIGAPSFGAVAHLTEGNGQEPLEL